MPDLDSLHFLRPGWLLALIPATLVVLLLARQQSAAARWGKVIAPHLLEHLVVRPQQGWRLRPLHLLVAALTVAVVATAGPAWRREPPPFAQDTAPLVLVLDLSQSMLVQDIQPSRLERAKHKIRDLLGERKGARTGLLVFAGSAHMVLPLTDDPSVIEAYVADLEPAIMPVVGKDPAAALAAAEAMLADDATPGSILFLTDGIAAAAVPAFERHEGEHRDQVLVLAVATVAGGMVPGSTDISTLDQTGLRALRSRTSATITAVTVDDTDIRRLTRSIATHLDEVQKEDEAGRWRDEGWWLVWPVAAIVLLWFRRGWLVQWEA